MYKNHASFCDYMREHIRMDPDTVLVVLPNYEETGEDYNFTIEGRVFKPPFPIMWIDVAVAQGVGCGVLIETDYDTVSMRTTLFFDYAKSQPGAPPFAVHPYRLEYLMEDNLIDEDWRLVRNSDGEARYGPTGERLETNKDGDGTYSARYSLVTDAELLPYVFNLTGDSLTSASMLALDALALFHEGGEISLVTQPRNRRRRIKRKTGMEPSPYFTVVKPGSDRLEYLPGGAGQGAGGKKREHIVRGHFRHVANHPRIPDGTYWISSHIRGGGENAHKQGYRIVLGGKNDKR